MDNWTEAITDMASMAMEAETSIVSLKIHSAKMFKKYRDAEGFTYGSAPRTDGNGEAEWIQRSYNGGVVSITIFNLK